MDHEKKKEQETILNCPICTPDENVKKAIETIQKIKLPWPEPGVFYVPKEHVDSVLETFDKLKSNVDIKSNVTIKKWWHFQWFMNLQVKLFGKCKIY